MLRSSWVAADLAYPQEGLSSMKLVPLSNHNFHSISRSLDSWLVSLPIACLHRTTQHLDQVSNPLFQFLSYPRLYICISDHFNACCSTEICVQYLVFPIHENAYTENAEKHYYNVNKYTSPSFPPPCPRVAHRPVTQTSIPSISVN
jgi:hypothetical protein